MSQRKPSFVSLTGADDTTDPKELARLSEQFPFVEWAILSSSKAAGKGRYPTDAWVERFGWECPNVNRALHLCGADVDAFIAGDAAIMHKLARFDRVQLNFNHRRAPKDLEAIARRSEDLAQSIIVQHNNANIDACAALIESMSNLHVLYDASGGRGKSPDAWQPPIKNIFCGYAGGLGPDNIKAELERISAAVGKGGYWIDMEGKLRDAEDKFSIAACEAVLSLVDA